MQTKLKLQLGGKERLFTFGIHLFSELLDDLDMDYSEMLQATSKNIFKYTPIIMYHSLKNTCFLEDKSVDFTIKDIHKWLNEEDDMGVSLLTEFIQVFFGTNDNKTPIEDDGDDDKKKIK